MENKHVRPMEEEDISGQFDKENNEPGELGYNYGDDAIEVDKGEGEKIVYGSTFSSKDGDLGDESEDHGDLPSAMRKGEGHMYDPTLSSGPSDLDEDPEELKDGIHLADAGEIGMAFGPDNYVDDDEEEE